MTALVEPEGDDEGERRRERLEAEHLGGQERQDRPLLADHPADERIDRDQQRELAELGSQAKADGVGGGVRCLCRLDRNGPAHAPVAGGRSTAPDQSRVPPTNTAGLPPARQGWRRSSFRSP